MRVVRQWRLRTVDRCFKSWATAYVRRCQILRDIYGPDATSDDEERSRSAIGLPGFSLGRPAAGGPR